MTMRLFLFCLLATLHLASNAQSNSLKSPDEFLPHRLGTRFTPHHLLVDYFQYIDRESPKVNLLEYGLTYELRPLVVAIISSEANLERLEEIRLNNLRRTGLEAGEVKEEDIAIVHLSYSVHGNEAAGSECAMAVLHDLASGAGGADAWLDNTIVLLDPCLNPDGYSRYSQWSNSVSAAQVNVNPAVREHREPWPGGRPNHYYFDLNRDWAWLSQQESKDRIALYTRWMPHVHADIHEMGAEAPYYFAPAAQPYHPYLTSWQADFQAEMGRHHAAKFDSRGWRYFTRERFDLFYPSYGDTYPSFSGAIGMTYEQGGSGYANRAVLLQSGDTLTLHDRIEHHRVATLSTIETASRNAGRLIREFSLFYRQSASNPPGNFRAYVISRDNHPARMRALTSLLDKQRIQYGQVRIPGSHVRGFSYATGAESTLEVQPGDLIIPAAQPRGVLTQVLFDPVSALTDSLTYDITAWSLPMAYGLRAWATEEVLSMDPWTPPAIPRPDETRKWYAYAVEWGSLESARCVISLLRQGIVARYAREPFVSAGVNFPAGTVLLMQADNRKHPAFHETVVAACGQTDVPVRTIRSGLVEAGRDLGSDAYPVVRAPRVVSFAGEGVSSLHVGEIWHFFEEELGLQIDLLPVGDLPAASLQGYNVLILPEGQYTLPQAFLDLLQTWITRGGRVIAIGGANGKLAGKPGFELKLRHRPAVDSVHRQQMELYPDVYAASVRAGLSEDIPGAVFRTVQDATHPLSFGLAGTYHTLKTRATAYAWLPARGNVLWLDESPVLYGFAGYKARQNIAHTLVAGVQPKGQGSVVYLIDNPLFRSFWYSGKILVSNALLF